MIDSFLSTPPSRVATELKTLLESVVKFLSTPPSRVATRSSLRLSSGCRVFLSTPPSRVATINTGTRDIIDNQFLSTPPSRVATAFFVLFVDVSHRFYPRHPRGWRRQTAGRRTGQVCFYPRHPRGWRLRFLVLGLLLSYVSIHATLAGGDFGIGQAAVPFEGVSIHATLAGGDLSLPPSATSCQVFLSTPPSRVATGIRARVVQVDVVSIHATLAGGDRVVRFHRPKIFVSIHATLAGGDCCKSDRRSSMPEFLSTPPSRVATEIINAASELHPCFYPRHPRGWRPARL